MQVMLFGGDMRTVWLGERFERDGNGVWLWGMDKAGQSPVCPEKAGEADMLVLPYPCLEGGDVRAPFSGERLSLERFFELAGDRVCFWGAPDPGAEALAEERGVRIFDYATETLLKENAGLTAEGALAVAINGMPGALEGSRVLVVGCGRIGRELAVRLSRLGAQVTLRAWRKESLLWARARGFAVSQAEGLEGFDCVFNTVPRRVIGSAELEGAGRDCLFVELASAPGGLDPALAESFGKRLAVARGLPGRTAPSAAAGIIYREIMRIWETEEI